MDILEQAQPLQQLRVETSDIQGESERAGPIQTEERKVQVDLINVYPYMMGVKKMDSKVFSVVPIDIMKGNGHRLKCRKFC